MDTDKVRKHLLKLSRKGVGYKQVAKVAKVNHTMLQQVRVGLRRQMRAQSAQRVLAVGAGARAPSALVPAGPTRRRIEWLLEEGFTKRKLARMLGAEGKNPRLQMRSDRVLARTARKVKTIWKQYQ